jgi:exopolysaccharide biosynthesis polyprenyl glycosylphosphotransferase
VRKPAFSHDADDHPIADRAGRIESAKPGSGTVARSSSSGWLRRLSFLGAASDFVAFSAGLTLARILIQPFGTHPAPGSVPFVASPLVEMAMFAWLGLYPLMRLPFGEEFRRSLAATGAAIGIVVVAFGVSDRAWIAIGSATGLFLLLVSRHLWRRAIARRRRSGRLAIRTLIIGSNDEADQLTGLLETEPEGHEVVGHVRTQATGVDDVPGARTFSVAELEQAIRWHQAECLFVVLSAVTPSEIRWITRAARLCRVDLRLATSLSNICYPRLAVVPLGPETTLAFRPVPLRGWQPVAKRAMDLALSVVAITLGFPLFLLIALAVRLDSPGPVVYRQIRIGRDGKPFTIFKFRTMVVDAEHAAKDLEHLNVAVGALIQLRDDPRITRVGRFLRRWSLDELPQIVNVVKGELSLVGPRPALPSEVELYEDWQLERFEVKPGITGLWQVLRQGRMDFEEYIRLDLLYVENWRLGLDVYILLKTLPHLMFREGEF